MLGEKTCHCECHNKNMHMMHIVACCTRCKYCNKRIKLSYLSDHEDVCLKGISSIIFEAVSLIPDDEVVWSITAKQMREELKNNTVLAGLFTDKIVKEHKA